MAKKTARQTGKPLETDIASIYRKLGARKVEHNVELVGNQIDVYVELEAADKSLHRIAIESKDWSAPVGIDIVNNFATIVDNLRRQRLIDEGVIVSNKGFSKQARTAAKTHGLRLLEPDDLITLLTGQTKLRSRTNSEKSKTDAHEPSANDIVKKKQELKTRLSEFIEQIVQLGMDARRSQDTDLAEERFERLSQKIRKFLADNVSQMEADRFNSRVHHTWGGVIYRDPNRTFYEWHISPAITYLEALVEAVEKGDVELIFQ